MRVRKRLEIHGIGRHLIVVGIFPIYICYNPLGVVVGVSFKRLEMSVVEAVTIFVNDNAAFKSCHLISRDNHTVTVFILNHIAGGEKKEIVGILSPDLNCKSGTIGNSDWLAVMFQFEDEV